MSEKSSIILMNDSFPPLIDGVANAVVNYAKYIQTDRLQPIVVTPSHPEANDAPFPFPVLRYPSFDLRNRTGYMAGIPFSPELLHRIENQNVSVIHSHCPIISTMLGRELRQTLDVPLILTYHTKFDIDIANILKSKLLQDIGKRALLENINACDEVWAVSRGARDNLRSLGYEGDCIIMENGVDLPRGRVSDAAIADATGSYDLPAHLPVFLFVGRIMWYKGLRIILDSLARLKNDDIDFRMFFIGSGNDLPDVQDYVQSLHLQGKCIFVGPISDRETLRAWYCRSDLFLFPSTFDTNGLVVREAASCSLASVLIEGSCAAEETSDGRNCLWIQENADSLYQCLKAHSANKAYLHQLGENACADLYLSWEDAVKKAAERYEVVIDKKESGYYQNTRQPLEDVFRLNGEIMDGLAHLIDIRNSTHELLSERAELLTEHIAEIDRHIHNK